MRTASSADGAQTGIPVFALGRRTTPSQTAGAFTPSTAFPDGGPDTVETTADIDLGVPKMRLVRTSIVDVVDNRRREIVTIVVIGGPARALHRRRPTGGAGPRGDAGLARRIARVQQGGVRADRGLASAQRHGLRCRYRMSGNETPVIVERQRTERVQPEPTVGTAIQFNRSPGRAGYTAAGRFVRGTRRSSSDRSGAHIRVLGSTAKARNGASS